MEKSYSWLSKYYREKWWFKNNEIVVKDNYIIDYQPRTEGEKVHIDTTKYERDPKLREQAIKYHGTKCAACNFDFEKNMER